MSICGSTTGVPSPCAPTTNCPDGYGCSDQCPDFTIKRYDIKPPMRIAVSDCDGPLDLTEENLVLEVNMWAKGKLKSAITADDTYFALADNIGFEQAMVGDTIVIDRARLPERMEVTGFDETNGFIQVNRGIDGTTASAWKKGTPIRIFRIIGGTAAIETVTDDAVQEDGTTSTITTGTYLVYEWNVNDTCLPGCYWLEYKLLKMAATISMLSVSTTPSFTEPSLTPVDFGCKLGDGVEWVRRFPTNSEAFLVKIVNSPTAEL